MKRGVGVQTKNMSMLHLHVASATPGAWCGVN